MEELRSQSELAETLAAMVFPTAAPPPTAVLQDTVSTDTASLFTCFDCGVTHPGPASFSTTQLRKKPGQRRCRACVSARPICHDGKPTEATTRPSESSERDHASGSARARALRRAEINRVLVAVLQFALPALVPSTQVTHAVPRPQRLCPWTHAALGLPPAAQAAVADVRAAVETSDASSSGRVQCEDARVDADAALAAELGLVPCTDVALAHDSLTAPVPAPFADQSSSCAWVLPSTPLVFPFWADPARSGGLPAPKAERKKLQEAAVASALGACIRVHACSHSSSQSAAELPPVVIDCGSATGNCALALPPVISHAHAQAHGDDVRANEAPRLVMFDVHARSSQVCAARLDLARADAPAPSLPVSAANDADAGSSLGPVAAELLQMLDQTHGPSDSTPACAATSTDPYARACVHLPSLPTERLRCLAPVAAVTATHACGEATDWALAAALRHRGAVVAMPCCSGKMSGQAARRTDSNAATKAAEAGTETAAQAETEEAEVAAVCARAGGSPLWDGGADTAAETAAMVGRPRSHTLLGALQSAAAALTAAAGAQTDMGGGSEEGPAKKRRLAFDATSHVTTHTVESLYLLLARTAEATAADAAPDVPSAPGAAGAAAGMHALAKTVLELDRVAWLRERGWAAVLCKMLPLAASRKNDVIVAVPREWLSRES